MNHIKIYYSEALVEQYRFPHSKKKRIRKKWAARSENFKPRENGYQMPDGTLVFHTSMRPQIEKMMQLAINEAFRL